MIRVVVVAAWPAVRAGLRAMLAGEPDIVVETALPGDGVPPDDAADPPDAIVADIDGARPDLLAGVARQFPDAALVALLDGPEAYPLDRFDTARPHAALLRDAGPEEILTALRAVMRGLVVLDPAIARSLELERPRRAIVRDPDATHEHESLTEREHEVLQLLALGLANKMIASRLGISEHTAKFHVGSILAKLQAGSRTEAVAIAARDGLLEL